MIDAKKNREVAIKVSGLKKKFRSYEDKATSLKERFVNPSRKKHEDIWVLKGIDFEVFQGEAIGIIGKNGCGKSTTLKLLTRILYPNEGVVEIKGRVSSLIELGAGFHPDMTGRENIYTNASIFGITKKEVDRRLNDIIRFSELEDFIDQPVRTYSSGMYMRLAFAVAINVDADVLLIDEILAVGDSSFQKKCFEKLQEIKRNGTTIVIVSHSMDQMYKICDRLIWLEKGLLKEEGTPKIIGELYLNSMEGKRLDRIEFEKQQRKKEVEEKLKKAAEEKQKRAAEEEQKRNIEKENARKQEELLQLKREKEQELINETAKELTKYYRPGARRLGTGEVRITSVKMKTLLINETDKFSCDDEIIVEMTYKGLENIKVNFIIGITNLDGIFCYGTTTRLDAKEMILSKKEGTAVVKFKNALTQGKYLLDVRIRNEEDDFIDNVYSLMEFEIIRKDINDVGIVCMEHEWSIDKQTILKIGEKDDFRKAK